MRDSFNCFCSYLFQLQTNHFVLTFLYYFCKIIAFSHFTFCYQPPAGVVNGTYVNEIQCSVGFWHSCGWYFDPYHIPAPHPTTNPQLLPTPIPPSTQPSTTPHIFVLSRYVLLLSDLTLDTCSAYQILGPKSYSVKERTFLGFSSSFKATCYVVKVPNYSTDREMHTACFQKLHL